MHLWGILHYGVMIPHRRTMEKQYCQAFLSQWNRGTIEINQPPFHLPEIKKRKKNQFIKSNLHAYGRANNSSNDCSWCNSFVLFIPISCNQETCQAGCKKILYHRYDEFQQNLQMGCLLVIYLPIGPVQSQWNVGIQRQASESIFKENFPLYQKKKKKIFCRSVSLDLLI